MLLTYHGPNLGRWIPRVGAALTPLRFFAQRTLQKALIDLSQVLSELVPLGLCRVFGPLLALFTLDIVAFGSDVWGRASLLATASR